MKIWKGYTIKKTIEMNIVISTIEKKTELKQETKSH